MLEKRKSIRVECELTISFRDLDSADPGRIESAIIKNISRGGIKIRVDALIPIQNRLHISLRLPNQTIEVQVKPSWIIEQPQLGKYDMGARFLDMKEEYEEAIETFQYQALLQKMPLRPHVVKDHLKDNPGDKPDVAA